MTPEIHDGPDNSVHTAGEHANVNYLRFDLGPMTLVAIAVFSLIVGACGVVIGIDLTRQSQVLVALENDQRAFRMAELKYDELNLTVRRAGLALPGDYRSGVGGNMDSEAFRKPKVTYGRDSVSDSAQRSPSVPDGPH